MERLGDRSRGDRRASSRPMYRPSASTDAGGSMKIAPHRAAGRAMRDRRRARRLHVHRPELCLMSRRRPGQGQRAHLHRGSRRRDHRPPVGRRLRPRRVVFTRSWPTAGRTPCASRRRRAIALTSTPSWCCADGMISATAGARVRRVSSDDTLRRVSDGPNRPRRAAPGRVDRRQGIDDPEAREVRPRGGQSRAPR